MALKQLMQQLGAGLWSDRIHQIRKTVAVCQLTDDDRKSLQRRVLDSVAKGKRTQAVNLLCLGLVAEKERWSDWTRRSGIFRASKYDFKATIPNFVVSALLGCASDLQLQPGYVEYLASIQNLLALASNLQDLQVSLIKRLQKDRKHAVKGLLATLDLVFMIRAERDQLLFDGFTPEELADGFSYILFLFADRLGNHVSDTGALNLGNVTSGFYLEMIKDGTLVRSCLELEVLVDHFDYLCLYDPPRRTLTFRARDEQFEKSVRMGYIDFSAQRIAVRKHASPPEGALTLRDCGRRLYDLMNKNGFVKFVENPLPRWRFEFPLPPVLVTFIQNNAYFENEASGLLAQSRDLLVDMEKLEQFRIKGIRIWSIVRVQRLINLLRYAIVAHLAPLMESDLPMVAQSLIPVFSHRQLVDIISAATTAQEATCMLELLTWQPKERSVFDVLYQPIIEIKPGWYMLPPNISGTADLVRNLMAMSKARILPTESDPLGEYFAEVLRRVTDNTRSSVRYKYAQKAGELDTVALIEDVLFVFECKNSLHPCSVFELRTSFDHLLEARDQLDRFVGLWREADFRSTLQANLGWDLSRVKAVVTCIVTGNRMFVGLRIGGHAVRPFWEIGNFIITGKVEVFDQTVRVRDEGPVTASALKDFIESDSLHGKTFAAMERFDETFRIGDASVVVESYRLNPLRLGAAFGVKVPTEVEREFEALTASEAAG